MTSPLNSLNLPLIDMNLLGSGTFGEVFQGFDPHTGQNLAIKLLHPTQGTHQDTLKQELRLLSQVDHVNIASVYRARADQGERPWILMELVENARNITTYIAQKQSNSEDIKEILQGVISGLHTLHTHGLCHRDIKPSNILVNKDDVVKFVDFGLAGLVGSPQTNLAGTTAYMAPEALYGIAPDPTQDLYSLGVVLFQSLTGKLPVSPNHPDFLERDQIAAPRLSSILEEVTDELDDLVADLLSGNPVQRPSCKEIAHRLNLDLIPPRCDPAPVPAPLPAPLLDNLAALIASPNQTLLVVHSTSSWIPGSLSHALRCHLPQEKHTILAGRCAPGDETPFRALEPLRALSTHHGPNPLKQLLEGSPHDTSSPTFTRDLKQHLLECIETQAKERVVLVLESAQLGDADSARWLHELLEAFPEHFTLVVELENATQDHQETNNGELLDELLAFRAAGGIPGVDAVLNLEESTSTQARRVLPPEAEEMAWRIVALEVPGPLDLLTTDWPFLAMTPWQALHTLEAQGLAKRDTRGRVGWHGNNPTTQYIRSLHPHHAAQKWQQKAAERAEHEPGHAPDLKALLLSHTNNHPKAAHHAEKAAHQALAGFAPSVASTWAERSLHWHADPPPETLQRRTILAAQAAERAGKPLLSASRWAQYAKLDPNNPHAPFKAASLLLQGGEISEGQNSLLDAGRNFGVSIPRSQTSIGLKVASALGWYFLPGKRWLSTLPPKDTSHADLLWALGTGFGNVRPTLALLFILLSLKEARRAGYPQGIARSLGLFSGAIASTGISNGHREIKTARAIAETLQSVWLDGALDVFEAALRNIEGNWKHAHKLAKQASVKLQQSHQATPWETNMSFVMRLLALSHLGDVSALRTLALRRRIDAQKRGDRADEVVCAQFQAFGELAAGDLQRARKLAEQSITRWTTNFYSNQHFYAARLLIYADLLDQNTHSATTLLNTEIPKATQGGIHRISLSGIELALLKTRVGYHKTGPSSPWIREALHYLKRQKRPDAKAHLHWIKAAQAQTPSQQRALLEKAHNTFHNLNMHLDASLAQLALARVQNKCQEAAMKQLHAHGIANPKRWCFAFLPGPWI